MAGSPTIRLYQVTVTEPTHPVGTVLDMTDTNSNQEDFTILRDNIILDVVNTPDPTQLQMEVQLWKGGMDTGKRFYSEAMDPASAGRVAVGPINMFPGRFQLKAKVLSLGSLSSASEVFGISIKYDKNPA